MSKYYAETHEWAEVQADGSVWVGISEYAQKALGDIVFISFPEVGSSLSAKEHFGDVESVKAVSELFSPLSGKVLAVNEELIQAPEKLNEDALGTWILKLEGTLDAFVLMDEAAYLESVKGH